MSTLMQITGPRELVDMLHEANAQENLQAQIDELANDGTPDEHPHLKFNTYAHRLECHHCKEVFSLPKEDTQIHVMGWIFQGFMRDHANCELNPDFQLPPIPKGEVLEHHAHLLPEGAREWLETGERGSSSETILTVLTGYPTPAFRRQGYPFHPLDPDDLRRCALLLKAVPSLNDDLNKMIPASPEWSALIRIWPDLITIFVMETDAGNSAPETFAMIRLALETARK